MECLWTGGGWKNLHQPPTYLKKDQPSVPSIATRRRKCPAISFKQATKNMKEKNFQGYDIRFLLSWKVNIRESIF
jgi:hypothetical protein